MYTWLRATVFLFNHWAVSSSFATPWTVVHGILQARIGVGCHFLLQGIFPTQGSNLALLHCRQIFLPLSHQGSPQRVYAEQNMVSAPSVKGKGDTHSSNHNIINNILKPVETYRTIIVHSGWRGQGGDLQAGRRGMSSSTWGWMFSPGHSCQEQCAWTRKQFLVAAAKDGKEWGSAKHHQTSLWDTETREPISLMSCRMFGPVQNTQMSANQMLCRTFGPVQNVHKIGGPRQRFLEIWSYPKYPWTYVFSAKWFCTGSRDQGPFGVNQMVLQISRAFSVQFSSVA